MPGIRIEPFIRNVVPIMLGTAIYAFGLYYFVIPNELMEGGLTGVALLLKYIFGLPPSLTTLLINVPLFIWGWRVLGRAAMLYTVAGTLSLSFFLWIMELLIAMQWIIPFQAVHDSFLIAAYAGLTLGAGLGIVFRYGGTTGGSDIMARMAQKKQGWSMGRFILTFDVAVIGSSAFFIATERILYTFVMVFIASKLIDIIMEGAYAAKAFLIITDSSPAITEAITKQLDRGATIIPAVGAYSGHPKNAVYCVVYRQEMKRLKDLVRAIDPRAFIIINEVHDVLGEGFKPE